MSSDTPQPQTPPDPSERVRSDDVTESTTVPTRQCGRCRAEFPGDPTIEVGTIREWWLCPPCRTALLGGGHRPRSTTA